MDNPIRGRTRELTRKVEATVPMNIHNRFDVEVIDSRTGKIRQRAQAENVICNSYWGKIGSLCKSIAVGAGSGTPSATDTALFSPLKSYSNLSWTHNTSNIGSGILSETIGPATILETELVGSTITEVGYGTTSAIYTHAMLKDANGNQISIAKTSTDIVKVYCTIFVHFSTDSLNGIEIGDSPGYIIGILALIYDVSSTATYKFTSVDSTTVSVSTTFTNDSANKQLKFATARLAAASGNFLGGLNKINIDITYYPDLFIANLPASWYPGSNIVGEAIGTGDGVTTAFATDFPYASNATIYVDGVAVPATVTNQAALGNNIAITTPPASGAVITADYHTPVIAKDSNHVFDFTLTIQLGEYTS